MKSLLAASIFGIALAGASLAQSSSPQHVSGGRQAAKPAEAKLAVVEFSTEPGAAAMTHEARRQLQASLAHALFKGRRFAVVDVKWTREASKADLAKINGAPSTADAVRLGKQLGVSHVLAGSVVAYQPKGPDGFGRATMKTRLIEVATGQVKHAGETVQQSMRPMKSDGAEEMQAKVLLPAIERLASTLQGVAL